MDSKEFQSIDAVGRLISLESLYGYSSTANGYARTVIGKATKITNSGLITLEIVRVRWFLYGQPLERANANASHVNVRPHLLFPVNDADLL